MTLQTIARGPSQVHDYATGLAADAAQAKVRGVICFEDRVDGFVVSEIGSCNPPSAHARMVMVVIRWLLRILL